MRRLVTERAIRPARLAWSLAVFALMSAAISVLVIRFQWVETPFGLVALGASLAVALAAIVVAMSAFARIWRSGERGAGRATSAFLLAIALIGPPVAFLAHGTTLAPINDISTDLIDPPAFVAAEGERGIGANSTTYRPADAPVQKRFYPEIQPLLIELPVEDTFDLIQRLAKERRWRVLDSKLNLASVDGSDDSANRDNATFEAVVRTLLLGLEDDVSIRLRDVDGRTRVDMRSASRFGEQDQGVNAARIREFLEAVRVNSLIR